MKPGMAVTLVPAKLKLVDGLTVNSRDKQNSMHNITGPTCP
jgi:hypothetical protein